MDVRAASRDVRTVKILNYASANADRTSAVIDTLGFGGLRIDVDFATIAANAVTNIYLTHSDVADDTNTLNSGTNVANSSQTVADDDDNQVFVIECIPTKRYYQLVVNKDAANATAESAIAYLYNAKEVPVTHGDGSGVGDGLAAVNYENIGVATTGTA